MMINRTEKANEPRWKKPWIDRKTGKRKGGFWYFNHNGKRQTLTKYGALVRKTRGYPQALRARDRFLAEVKEGERGTVDQQQLEQARLQDRKDSVLRVLDIVNFYLTNHRRIAASSRPEAERILINFATGKDGGKNGIESYRGFGKLLWNQLGNEHLDQWVNAHPNWNDLSAVEIVKRVFNYAVKHRKQTEVTYNPIADWQPPDEQLHRFTRRQSKAYFRTEDEEAAFRRHTNPQFRQFFDANIQLGTRPGEIAKLTTQSVRGLDGEFLYWQLDWHDWKSGRKTQQARVIQLTPAWEEFTRHRVAGAQAGECLFLNERAEPWTKSGWAQSFRKAKLRGIRNGENISKRLTMMSTRHTFITRALKLNNSDVNLFRLAEHCGTSVLMIRRTYGHLLEEHQTMRNVVLAVNGLL